MHPSSPFHRTVRRGVAVLAACTLTGAGLLALPASAAVVPAPIAYSAADAALDLTPIGSYESGVFDASAAEIVAHHAATQRLFVVNAQLGAIDVLDVEDPTDPVFLFSIEVDGVSNSVSVRPDGLGVIAVEAVPKTDPGSLVFFDASGAGGTLGAVQVGAQPDMVAVSADGTYAVVADEGEPNDDYTVDPEGSVSIVTLPEGVAAPDQGAVRTAGFAEFEEGGTKELRGDVRIFAGIDGAPNPVAAGLEPEYVTIDGGTAYVTLQENNAIAMVDLATAEVTDVWSLGYKDHGVPGNGISPSDRARTADPSANIRTFPGLRGIYQPDSIDSYTAGGRTYLVTANEGDAREWGDYVEGVRVKNLGSGGVAPLCADSPLAGLTGDADLGRLNVSTASGLTEAGCYGELYAFGARSFSIWTPDGTQVFDSGDDFEQITAAANPGYFNSNHSESNLEGRSDDKGPEPEGVVIGEVDGRTYAFIGFERVGGIAVYDITDPADSTFVTYVNNRNLAQSGNDGGNAAAAGDLGPEGLTFIPAEDSPTGEPLLAVGNEVSGTTTLFAIGSAVDAATTTVQVLGINDFHGRLEANGAEAGAAVLAGAVGRLRAENPNTLFVSAGDNIGASTFTSFSQDDTPTIDALRVAGLDASVVGNHEFDRGFADLTERVLPGYGGTQFGLGANVYSAATGEPALDEYYIQEVDGVRVGFIGTVTESTPSGVTPTGIAGLTFGDQLEAANRVAAQLKDGDPANGEADVLVLLTHEGSASTDCDAIGAETTDFGELIRGADAGIDAILSGHTHQQYNCSFPVEGWDGERERPVLQTGQYGTTLDQLEIEVDREDRSVVSVTSALLPLTETVGEGDDEETRPLYPADPAVAAIVAAAVDSAEVEGAKEVGSITADILRGGTNGSDRGVESSLGNLVADMQLWATSNENLGGEPAQIALMNPGGLRADLLFGEDGTTTYRDVASVQPFANTLFLMDLTGAQLKQVLEEQWQPEGSTRPKLHLGVSEGFGYAYDPGAARGEHILSMTFEGETIADDDVLRVTANSFLAAGGDNFTTFAEGTDRADSGQIDLIASVEYFEEFGTVEPAPLGRAALAGDTAPTPDPEPTDGSTPDPEPTDGSTPEPTPTDGSTPDPTSTPIPEATDGLTSEPTLSPGTGGGPGAGDGSGVGGGTDDGANTDTGSNTGTDNGSDSGTDRDDAASFPPGGYLANTGADVLLIAGTGLALALLGGLVLLLRRRRHDVEDELPTS
ncbi:5'-nucleotidase [Arthrobacter sp. RIT-PI-e]|uniref:choice-of-anchor I family protein n=1 Tax=Arthrobacter sp. RIT-PI-e TaxID=1681197 RepID=UPI000675E63E|nr:choice-of-anchor I family protein [Arthrobacter sp. RIT-PI-e]KNC20186.1 5'-nucleotidase [Arthrobacter sp. RIT-PI-e]